MARSIIWRLSLLIVCLAILVVPLSAQRRAVRGRVTNAQGSPVPGVSATLFKDGVQIRSVTTDADGQFDLDIVNLGDGTFEVRLEVAGGLPGRVTLSPQTSRSFRATSVPAMFDRTSSCCRAWTASTYPRSIRVSSVIPMLAITPQ